MLECMEDTWDHMGPGSLLSLTFDSKISILNEEDRE